LKAFLAYLSNHIPTDDFTRNLDAQVHKTTGDEDWRRQYMTLEEKIEMGRREGHAAGVEEGRDEKQCEVICNMVKKKLQVKTIAELLGMKEEALRAFAREHGIELRE
ncbi:MAG: hypothetical protein ACI4W2_04680, partial [Eubacterium sp.]